MMASSTLKNNTAKDEVVACYRLADGEPVWKHQDAVRFWESNAGPGPRGTPTLHQGRVYTFGATGVLNALDAQTGTVLWSRNAATDTKAKLPDWGFSSSPLAVGEHLIVATSGILAAYDLMTGAPRWTGPTEGGGYSSPHSLEIAGVRQIVFSERSRRDRLQADGRHGAVAIPLERIPHRATGATRRRRPPRQHRRHCRRAPHSSHARKKDTWTVHER